MEMMYRCIMLYMLYTLRKHLILIMIYDLCRNV